MKRFGLQLQMQEPKDSDQKESIYFKLVETVGTKGKYQTILVIFACLICIQNGIISLGGSYYLAIAPFTKCPQPHTGITKCTKYACSLPASERSQFMQPQINQLRTMGNQFGDYHCENSDAVQSTKGLYFLGAIIGFFLIGILGDNIGRRASLILCLVIGIVGYIVMLLAPRLFVAGIGLLLVGFSIESCFNLVFYLLSEMLENNQRQRMQTLIQAFLPLGGMFISFAFYFFKEWKIIFLAFCLIPYAFCFFFSYFFVVETPQFLIKCYSVGQIRQNLKFVAILNGRRQQFEHDFLVSENNLETMKSQYKAQIHKEHQVPFTYVDLFKYNSLRVITICSILLCFTNNFLYNAPLMLIDEFGFDFYLNGVILNFSELITYFFSFFAITKLKRRNLNVVCSIIAFICSFSLIFLHAKEICTENCFTTKIAAQMIIVFIMRFAVSLQFQVLYIYITELYPIQVGSMGLGFACIIGHIPNVVLPELINVLNRSNFSIMIVFSIISLISLVASAVTEETYGRQPSQRVQQIHHARQGKAKFQPINQSQDV